MGASLLKPESLEGQLQRQYRSVRRYMDEIYGDLTIIQHFLIKRITADTQIEFSLEKWEANTSPMFLRLKEYKCENMDMCSRAKQYYILTECCEKTLDKELSMRQYDRQYFTPNELTAILTGMISVVAALRFEKERLSLFSPKIFFLPHNLDLKILPPFLMVNNDECNSITNVSSRLSGQVLAPEVSKVLHRPEEADSKSYEEPSIVFQLGMIMMEAATLLDSFDMFVEGSADQVLIEQRLLQVQSMYGTEIESLLRGMVQLKPSKRPSLQETSRIIRGDLQQPHRTSKVIQEPRFMRQSQLISNSLYL